MPHLVLSQAGRQFKLHVRLANRGAGSITDLTLHDGKLTARLLREGEVRGADRTDLERALQDAWNG